MSLENMEAWESKKHECIFDGIVNGSETQLTPAHFRDGLWQGHTTMVKTCLCGNQINVTNVYVFEIKHS